MNNSSQHIGPPKLPLRFFRWFCRPEIAEDIEGDLLEKFQKHVTEVGLVKARQKFWCQILLLFRPGIIRSFKFFQNKNNPFMFRHNFLMSWRSLKKDKMTSFINISSLTVGIASVLLILLWVKDEMRFDKFHEHKERLYHVMNNVPTPNGILTLKSSAALLSQALQDEMPEVDEATVAAYAPRGRTTPGIGSYDGESFKADEFYVRPNFFEVFSYKVLEGNPKQILSHQNSVMISEGLAQNVFGDPAQAIGKTISWDRNELSGEYLIGGIFADVPSHSSMQFDLLFSFQHFYNTYEQVNNLWNWGNSNPLTFVLLKEGVDLEAFNTKIKNFSKDKYKQQNGEEAGWIGDLFTQSYSETYLYNGFQDGIQKGGRVTYVRLFSAIGLFILLIACINFMNMTTAKAGRRVKEIGVKKTIGASNSKLQLQYLVESTLMAVLALMFSALLVLMLLPSFNLLTEKELTLALGWESIAICIGVTLATGIISGSYPAFYLSRLKPIHVLGGFRKTEMAESWIRRGLVVFQFCLSAILFVGVLVLYNQMRFIQAMNLGYNRDNIIRIDNEGDLGRNTDVFLQEARQLGGVEVATTLNNNVTDNTSSTGSVRWPGWDESKRISFSNFQGGYGMFDVFDIEFVEGRSFSKEYSQDENAIIFNESAIAAMDLKDPIGQMINLWGQDRQIVGVVKDFHFESLYEPLRPCFFLLSPGGINILLKLKGTNIQNTLEDVESLYSSFNEGFPFEFTFIDKDYQELYATETKTALLARYFAMMAIIISCLGLYGMSVFSAERRLREISIRKILGSSVNGIITLLSKEFIIIVGTALLIALPLSYVLARRWLNSFAYHSDLHWWYFALTALVCITIAVFTISYQTMRASAVNPVRFLKDE